MSTVRNLDWLRNLSTPELPDLGPKLYEALSDIIQQHSTTSQQNNANPTGNPTPPPSISSLKVSAQNGHFQVAINDQGPIYRGVNYFVEHSASPHFTDPHVIDLGASRNHSIFLGNVTRYWRAYSSYASSPAGAPAYHGGTTPQPVSGGGAVGGPAFLASQGSGTGTAGQGIQGPGSTPFRSNTGAPPPRVTG